MVMSKQSLLVATVGVACLFLGQQSFGDFYIMSADNRDIGLTEQDRNDIAEEVVSLVENPSAALLASIESGDGIALIMDQREEQGASHDLRMDITYPEPVINGHTKTEAKIMCEGSYDPVSLEYCREASNFSLKLPGYNFVRINDDPITIEEMADMFAYLDSANLESETGSAITSHGVHHLLLNSRSGLYHLIGGNESGEQFFVYLRPIENGNGTEYEITEWSCQ